MAKIRSQARRVVELFMDTGENKRNECNRRDGWGRLKTMPCKSKRETKKKSIERKKQAADEDDGKNIHRENWCHETKRETVKMCGEKGVYV